MRMGSAQQYVKVGPADVAYAGKRTSLMMGPVAHRGAEYARTAFRSLAQRGPSARVGLQPSSTSNRWLFDPDRSGVISAIVPRDYDELLNEFESFVARASCGTEPIVVTFCGEYIMLSWDHGIGDATACLELAAVASGGDIADYLVPNAGFPLRSAVTRTVVKAPRSMIDGLRTAPGAAELSTRPYPPADVKNIVMTHVRTDADFLATIKKMRKEFFPDTSITAAVTYAVRSAFDANGIGTSDDISVLVDLRRYLDEGEVTLANLSGVAELSAPSTMSINDFGATFAAAVSGVAPLVRLTGSIAKRRLRGWRAAASGATDWPVKARLTFSDPTRHPAMKKIRWSSGDQPMVYALINDPGLPHQITITAMCDVEQCFQFTACYYSGSYERAEIDRIMNVVAKDLTQYLAPAVRPGMH
jgi:hypothetical protein